MAKIRIGFSTHFEIENELAGIGTDNPTNTKQVLGNIHATNAKGVGVSTFTTFDGFVDTKASISGLEGSEQGSISGEIVIEGNAIVSSGTTFTSGPENLTVTDSFTLPGISDDKPSVGTTRFNDDLGSLEFYTGSEWRAVNSRVDVGNRGRGITGMWEDAPAADLTALEFVNIQSKGNSKSFGDLTVARMGGASCSSSTRGIWAGGNHSPTKDDEIDYITIASEGNAVDFGNLGSATAEIRGCSSSTRGLFAGGQTPSQSNTIESVEIPTTGNAVDFGDLSNSLHATGGLSSPTRGIFGGGHPGYLKHIDFVTISSKGNAKKFGELTQGRKEHAACSNSVRGVFAGGAGPIHPSPHRTIDYITIASEGNAIDFGEQTVSRGHFGGAGDQTRAVFFAGRNFSVPSEDKTNIIDYIEIVTTGNAVDFGDCSGIRRGNTALSDSHGGLGGF